MTVHTGYESFTDVELVAMAPDGHPFTIELARRLEAAHELDADKAAALAIARDLEQLVRDLAASVEEDSVADFWKEFPARVQAMHDKCEAFKEKDPGP